MQNINVVKLGCAQASAMDRERQVKPAGNVWVSPVSDHWEFICVCCVLSREKPANRERKKES